MRAPRIDPPIIANLSRHRGDDDGDEDGRRERNERRTARQWRGGETEASAHEGR